MLALLVVSALGVAGCSRSSKSGAALKELSVDEVAARIAKNDGKTFVYDNNPKDRYQESHVPGAHWLDFKAVDASELPTDRSATLIFYCANEL